jgi:ribose 5-phosphate isomerase B
MKVVLGGDHAGFDYKKELIDFIKELGIEASDLGPYSCDSVDYPDFAHPVATAVETNEFDFGILICGSGNGVAMAANKHQGIRAALCWQKELAHLSRQHNNANILCLPARFMSLEMAKECVKSFLETPFEGGRHENRVDKIACN